MKPATPKSCRVWCVVEIATGEVWNVRCFKGNAEAIVNNLSTPLRVIPATLQFSTPKKKGKSHA